MVNLEIKKNSYEIKVNENSGDPRNTEKCKHFVIHIQRSSERC